MPPRTRNRTKTKRGKLKLFPEDLKAGVRKQTQRCASAPKLNRKLHNSIAMKALVFHAPGKVSVDTVPDPTIQKSDDVSASTPIVGREVKCSHLTGLLLSLRKQSPGACGNPGPLWCRVPLSNLRFP